MTMQDPGLTGWKAVFGLRAVAVFEAAKGLLVLLAGSGLLFLVHRDLQNLADQIVWHFHLDPAGRESRILYRALTEATPGRLRLLAAAAVAYAVFRFAEAWGLWNAKRWAELLGVVTGLIYVPFEIVSFVRHPRLVPLIAFIINVAIVWILARYLRLRPHASPVRDVPLRA